MNTAERSLRLGFAGTPQFAVPALDALVRSRHSVVGVLTQPDRPAGRGRTMQSSAVKQRAESLGLPVQQPASLKTPEGTAMLHDLALDALVVVAYGLILPPAVLAVPRLGCFNIHASLLPRWRGAAPIQRAILAGDAITGVTIMRMEAGLDTGPMLAVGEVAIGARDTAATLHDRLAQLGGDLVVESLNAVADGRARETAQPSIGVTYAEKIHKPEASIDWRGDASLIARQVRAFNPWPIAETRWDGMQLRVWDAAPAAPAADSPPPGTVFTASSDGIDVACGRGALRIQRLQLAGRKAVVAAEFIKAHRLIGARFAHP